MLVMIVSRILLIWGGILLISGKIFVVFMTSARNYMLVTILANIFVDFGFVLRFVIWASILTLFLILAKILLILCRILLISDRRFVLFVISAKYLMLW